MKTVEVKWHDARGQTGWHKAMETVNWAEDDSNFVVWSTGYLFGEQEDWVVLVSGVSGDMVLDAIAIPRSLIIEMREVRYAEEN